MKKWSSVFASSRENPNALDSRIAAGTADAPRLGHQRRVPHHDGRHEHVRQVVDDVVEVRAAEVGQALADADQARQVAVGRVDEHLQREPGEGDAVVVRQRRERREQRTDGACRRVGVHRPGRTRPRRSIRQAFCRRAARCARTARNFS